jgi:L-lactate utilization protein LutC
VLDLRRSPVALSTSIARGARRGLNLFRERRYAVFHTGPSATADIEGVLIQGAQGVRSLSVVPVPRVATGDANSPTG